MRVRIVLGLMACAACSDPKQQPSDALPEPWPPVVDAMCPGLELYEPDGGQVSVEYIHYDSDLQTSLGLPAGTSTQARVMAFFTLDQMPERAPLPVPGECVNLEATMGWPLFIGNQRVEPDAGTLHLVGKNAVDAPVDLAMPALPAGTDAMGRKHDVYYESVSAGADRVLKPNSSYTVRAEGTTAFGPHVYENNIFVPATFDVATPSLDDDGPINSATDYTVHWTPGVSTNLPAADEVLGVVWLADTNGKPTHLCANLHSAAQFTIRKSAIAEYKTVAAARGLPATKVLLIRQALDAKFAPLETDDPCAPRRIDMMGSVSWVQQMDVN